MRNGTESERFIRFGFTCYFCIRSESRTIEIYKPDVPLSLYTLDSFVPKSLRPPKVRSYPQNFTLILEKIKFKPKKLISEIKNQKVTVFVFLSFTSGLNFFPSLNSFNGCLMLYYTINFFIDPKTPKRPKLQKNFA